ncbi:Multiple C2 domain and transmembrane region protein 14 [Asimina triloba]
MAESCSRKLVVEVCNARNLMPKDGQGAASAYVLVDFDGQRRRTKTKFRDLNPQWDEKIEFLVHDPDSMASETLELNIYNDKKTGKRNNFLGKVKISGSCFQKSGSESLVYYPLEKRSVFSQIKGEIGLKISYIDEDPPSDPKPDAPAAATEGGDAPEEEEAKKEEKSGEKTEEKKEEGKPAEAAAKEDEKPSASENGKQEEEKKSDPAPSAEKPPAAAGESKEEKEKSSLAKIPPDSGVTDVAVRPKRLLSSSDRAGGAYDLVERMLYLYVRVVKAKRPDADTGSAYAKMVIGTHSIRTRTAQKTDWDQVFAFHKDDLNSTSLEVSVWTEKKDADTDTSTEACMGTVSFDFQEVPKRVPPDSPLAPQWYTLEGNPENSPATDVMLAVWVGTQADEAFQEAWQSDSGGVIVETRAKAYLSPKLWYLRLTVIQAQDLQLPSPPEPKARAPELYVKAQLGAQAFKTPRVSTGLSGSGNPSWNEDLVFVAAEPFEPFLVIGVEDVSSGQSVGQAKVQVSSIDRRVDDRTEPRSKWFNLVGDDSRPYAGRIHVRACLEGGYHVLDEAAHVASDVRAAAKQLSKPPIGSLEVGIRGACNLLPMKTKDGARGTTDAYVVAKYGPKWFRTRTLLDRFNPRWNEQYTWDVYDPCTVLTIGVFDNGRYKRDEAGKPAGKDVRIGKVRIRLSTLDANRVYLNSYSLWALHPSGAKKMGEIELAVRFTCSSWLTLVQAYGSPMLPRMHYVRPLSPGQQDILRHTAMRTVTARLARAEPALGQEVVQYMLDTDTHVWSMRRSKANWFRVVGCLAWAVALARWLDGVRTWAHASTTILVHMLLVAIVLCPHLVLPTVSMYTFFIVMWRYRFRYRSPYSIDPRLSYVDVVGPDELDEEFDTFPSSRGQDQVRVRYDRLRALAGRAQSLLGDMAAQGERVEALINWRDPRATGIFVVFCLVSSLVLYVVPFKALILLMSFYYLRHPRFRDDMPSVPMNFFRRLPSLADRIL